MSLVVQCIPCSPKRGLESELMYVHRAFELDLVVLEREGRKVKTEALVKGTPMK